MRFAHLTGILHSEEAGYRIEVILDDRMTVEIVRNEHIETLMSLDGIADPDWTVDQLTQETIGTTLAEQGWEAISRGDDDERAGWGPPMARYFVRR